MTSTKRTVDTTDVKTSDVPGVSDTDGLTEDNIAAATKMEASGAFIEPAIVDRIDVDHPAVDNHPRKGQPKIANQIDFNDPGLESSDAVEKNLKDQASA